MPENVVAINAVQSRDHAFRGDDVDLDVKRRIVEVCGDGGLIKSTYVSKKKK